MTSERVTGTDITKSGPAVGALADLPSSFPPWARQLAELYFSGTTAAFVLHGNTYDFVRGPARERIAILDVPDQSPRVTRRAEAGGSTHGKEPRDARSGH